MRIFIFRKYRHTSFLPASYYARRIQGRYGYLYSRPPGEVRPYSYQYSETETSGRPGVKRSASGSCPYSGYSGILIADFLKSCREYMHQETADEFHMPQRDSALRITRPAPPCRKNDLCVCYGEDPAVRDCDLMCITAEIFNGIAEAVKSFFYVRAPVFL